MILIFWEYLIFCQIFFSSHVPHELPNDLWLGIIGNKEISGKSRNFRELQPTAHSSSRMEILSVLATIF